MIQLLARTLVYTVFSFNFVKQIFGYSPFRWFQSFTGIGKEKQSLPSFGFPPYSTSTVKQFFINKLVNYFNGFIKSYVGEHFDLKKFFGSIPLYSNPGNQVKFDKNANFKDVMSEISDDFGRSYETIREYLLNRTEPEMKDVVDWMDKVIQYNVPHGKKTRGLILAASYKYFAPEDQLSDETIELSCIIGWCMEFLQASVLVIDDIMDRSVMRRGQRCWHTNEEVGNMAINDAIVLQHTIFEILKHYISDHRCYNEIAELTRQASYKTALGQCIDCLTTPEGGKTDFSLLIPSRYATIVKYKTSFYSFDLPVRLALLFAGVKDEYIHNETQKILIRMGHLFQAQDDFIDCFGDPEITGKVGTDIEDGKCCWVAVEAVKRMNDDQIKEFKEHYGSNHELSLQIIKLIYEDVGMRAVFSEFEESEYKEIRAEIAAFGKRSNIEVKPLYGLLDIIYKRKK